MPKVFVYGAQMAHPESLGAAWPARVRDHAVRFVARGLPGFEPVFAALEPAPGQIAHGVVVDFGDETWASLVRLERGYELAELDAELLDAEDAAELGAQVLRCQVLRIQAAHRTRREGRPSARYARKLAAGARAHGLPPEVIARYEQAVVEGSRASLMLAWVFPFAARFGLIQTALLFALVGLLVAITLVTWLIRAA